MSDELSLSTVSSQPLASGSVDDNPGRVGCKLFADAADEVGELDQRLPPPYSR